MCVYYDKAIVRWPKTAARRRIFGRGKFALGVACGVPKITLYETEAERLRELQRLDYGCGTSCVGRHDLFEISED
jgi:hypothetical protein